MNDLAHKVCKILDSKIWGVLSTISVSVPGFPVGSVVSYTMLRGADEGFKSPYFCLSDISEHTINAKANNLVSLTVWKGDEVEPQKLERVTWIGRLEKDPEMLSAFLEEMPSYENMMVLNDFNIYALRLARIRYIGGFAQAYWVEVDDLT